MIAWALEFYKDRGYVYVDDAPWWVSRSAYYSTKPDESGGDFCLSLESNGSKKQERLGHPVASGEQSFIQLMLSGRQLKKGICVTPCFREEKRRPPSGFLFSDRWHQTCFMKAELINADEVSNQSLIGMVHDAMSFFEQFVEVKVIQTSLLEYDIVDKRLRMELGSYGIREYDSGETHLEWVYGTAVAEPRFSQTLEALAR